VDDRVAPNYFGEEVARRYDDSTGPYFDPVVIARTVDVLEELAAGGAALELAIGTGRIGLPLAARGVRVAGIELSEAMAARLRQKPGAETIEVVIGDMASTRLDGEFSLAYLVFNTINNLTTQDGQVACFENAAAHLPAGGCFVVEVGLPQLQRVPPGERYRPFDVSDDHLGFDEYEIAGQGLVSHHWYRDGDTWRRNSIPFRYVWPEELDLMARIAGMRLRDRWADWTREPFTSESTKHVSVWEKV
jgi:hypothetical protein